MPSTGEKLRAFRLGIGVSQNELASLLQIDRAHLSRLETGGREMTDRVAERFTALRLRVRDALVLD